MRLPVALVLLAACAARLLASPQTPEDFRSDFDVMWRAVQSRYAYFDAKATAWDTIPALYADDLRRATTRDAFIVLLEQVVDELYDPHAHLNVNLTTSPRLVPSGTDLWAEWRNGNAVITDVRDGSDAQRGGIRPGDVVARINGVAVSAAIDVRLGRSYPHSTPAARDWALRAMLAGRHNTPRVIEVRRAGAARTVDLAEPDQRGAQNPEPVTHSEIESGIGYVRFNDSLANSATIQAFDRALNALRDTRALIVDLRNTSSGGNTVVARGILGRFVAEPRGYQMHMSPAEERETGVQRGWLEFVWPREDVYRRPVAVLVGHWTGSMGEGLAMGFDATGAGTVVGTAMAGLAGATSRIVLPATKIGLSIPTEKLFHPTGTPRELFQPDVVVDVGGARATDADPFVNAALQVLKPK